MIAAIIPRMNIRIILVEPHEAGNVGAAARAMKNFGIADLVIVGKRPLRNDEVSSWWAVGAQDVLQNLRRLDTLEEALRDVHLSVATTAARRRAVRDQLYPGELAELAYSTLSDEHTMAVVFGREESGLTTEEIAACQRTATIPTWPEFPTMNLAQSVAIFCYELAKAHRPPRESTTPAPNELLQYLHKHARELMERVDFFEHRKHEKVYAEFQALAGRANLSMREASILLDLIRTIHAKLRT